MKANTPSENKLRQYVAEGLTQHEMVTRHLLDTGVSCSRSAIAMKMTRLGIPAARTPGWPWPRPGQRHAGVGGPV